MTGSSIGVVFGGLLLVLATASTCLQPDMVRAQGRSATLGIGAVVHTTDSVTESFPLFRYLSIDSPIKGTTTPFVVRLIDHPIDAQYAVTGQFTGFLRHRLRRPALGLRHWFEYSHSGEIFVWRNGTKIEKVAVQCAGTTPETFSGDYRGEPPLSGEIEVTPIDIRYQTLRPCFEQLRSRLQAILSEDAR